MFEENKKLYMRVSHLLGLLLGFLVLFSSAIAEAGGPPEQHVTSDPEDRTWTKNITAPYWTNAGVTYQYYGLFLDFSSVEPYSVNSTISLNLKDLWGESTTFVDGIRYGTGSGKLYVSNRIDVIGAGWTPEAEATTYKNNTSVDIYGIRGGSSTDIISSAVINIMATGGTAITHASIPASANAYAFGIYSEGGAVINNGDISVAAGGGTATSFSNASANAYVSTFGVNSRGGAITNNGVISVAATGGAGTSSVFVPGYVDVYVYASAVGLYSGGGAITNNGVISVVATGGKTTFDIYGDASINANAQAKALGLNSGEVTNNGNISVKATGGTATSHAFIPAFAAAFADASGITSGGAITSNGDISVEATGGTAISSGDADAYVYAHAFGINGRGGAVTNHGDISAKAIGGTATFDANADADVSAYGINSVRGVVINSGSINVTAQAGTEKTNGRTTSAKAEAYGVFFEYTGILSSTGLITASAQFAPDVDPPSRDASPTAYQVFCELGTLTIKKYAMEVGHQQDKFTAMYEGQIGTGTGGNVLFENAELVVHVADNYQDGVYEIPRLWKQETEGQKVEQINQIATAVTAVPDLNVSLIPSTSANKLQQISLEYAPKESIPLKQALISLKLAGHIHSLIQDDLTGRLLSSMTSDASQTNVSSNGIDGSTSTMVASLSNPGILSNITAESSKQHSLFFRPVYVNSYDCASSGYSSNTYGFVLGYNYKVHPEHNDCFIGMHAGYTHGDIRYTGARYSDTKEFVDTYYGGFHGAMLLAKRILLSGEASFFYADSEVRDDNPVVLGKSDYDSVAIRAEAEVGYLWSIEGHSIIPEIGLNYSWQHRNSFAADNTNSPDIHYGTLDNNELYANARLKWLKRYDLSGLWTITPLVGVGVTQVLTDGEFSNSMRLGNETQMVVDQDEYTTFTPEINLTISSDACYTMVGYKGGFGGTSYNNMFWLQLGYNF